MAGVPKSPVKKKQAEPKKREEKHLCPYCKEMKKIDEYYLSSDPLLATGHTVMCKACAEKIARQWNDYLQEFGECTKASIQDALERLDKPYLDDVWESAYHAASSDITGASGKKNGRKRDVWGAYIVKISLPQYRGLRWRDGDLYEKFRADALREAARSMIAEEDIERELNLKQEYSINQRDVKRIVGYDPFENYPVEDDKPFLYSQLINFIDEETKNDGMKMNAVVQIVQSFNQIQKINDAINELSANITSLNQNNGTIKQHAETINKLLSGANALAKDNGISLAYNTSKSKGANTLTGKMKELEEIGFRSQKINMYDIDYCKGMQQVAEISAKAQIQQIGYDENVMNEINNIRRELVDQLQKERDQAVERARLLLVENRDLKSFLESKGLIDEDGKVIEDV